MEYRDVDFMQGRTGPALKIDYTQYNFDFSHFIKTYENDSKSFKIVLKYQVWKQNY